MKLYVYDHCPYCVKARMIFGLKNMPFELVTLLNDDEETPKRMIGKKMVPILERDPGSYMGESMDIVHYVDGLVGDPVLKPTPEDSVVQDWIDGAKDTVYHLAMPRWVLAPLAEFKTQGARDYFTKKKEAMIGPFDEVLAGTGQYLDGMTEHLLQLESMIESPKAAHGELTEVDIHLFATLRSLTIVKKLVLPPRVNEYTREMSVMAGVPLHWDIAV